MNKKIKATLANLEREEAAVAECFEQGREMAGTLREHVYNIKRDELWLAAGYDSFAAYCKSDRLRIGSKQIPMGHDHLGRLASHGQIEQYIPKRSIDSFSEEAFKPLAKLRVEFKDDITGEVKKTHDLDIRKIKAVISGVIAARDKALAKPGAKPVDGQITAKLVQSVIERKYGPKPVKALHEQLKTEQTRATKLLKSWEALLERDGNEALFSDAEEESPGCAKRLAAAYSKIASFLRRV